VRRRELLEKRVFFCYGPVNLLTVVPVVRQRSVNIGKRNRWKLIDNIVRRATHAPMAYNDVLNADTVSHYPRLRAAG
jgi:hypothetical protein